MLKTILLIGYLSIGIYHLWMAYRDSEIEDQRDVACVIGMMIGAILWPLIYLVMIICAIVQVYYEDEEEI